MQFFVRGQQVVEGVDHQTQVPVLVHRGPPRVQHGVPRLLAAADPIVTHTGQSTINRHWVQPSIPAFVTVTDFRAVNRGETTLDIHGIQVGIPPFITVTDLRDIRPGSTSLGGCCIIKLGIAPFFGSVLDVRVNGQGRSDFNVTAITALTPASHVDLQRVLGLCVVLRKHHPDLHLLVLAGDGDEAA